MSSASTLPGRYSAIEAYCGAPPSSEHVKELNNVRPKQPFYFLKPPSSIVLPGAGPVLEPKGIDLHYEVELGVIMGKQLRDFDASDEKGAIDAVECE